MMPDNETEELDELDRLIDSELQALLGRSQSRRGMQPRRKAEPGAPAAADNVVRAHPVTRQCPGRAAPVSRRLFSADEEAFLASTVAWLRSQPDSDILLDALNHAVLQAKPAPVAAEEGGEGGEGDEASGADGQDRGAADEAPRAQ
jgi:hypothetical protein